MRRLLFVPLALFLIDGISLAAESPEPNTTGHANPPSLPGDLDPSRLEHGRSQVRQLFSDRFLMGAYRTDKGEVRRVTEADAIFQWLARKFAGEDAGEMLFWDSEPPNGYRAVHSVPTRHWLGCLRLSRVTPLGEKPSQRPLSFEELWACASFEMLGFRRSEDWRHLDDQVVKKSIGKEEYVEAAAKLEYRAFQATEEFYEKVWLPWARSVGFQSEKRFWRLPLPTYEDWRSKYTEHKGYPWKPFEDMFDQVLQYGHD